MGKENMIETLGDIVEDMANKLGIYGAHDEEDDEACRIKPCRTCWTSEFTERIWAAVRVEQALERGWADPHGKGASSPNKEKL